jgi:hypothetical protein
MNLRLAIAGVLLLAGCTPGGDLDPEPAPTASRPRPSPTASMVRAEMMAALQKLNSATFSFSMSANTNEGGTVTATGTVDPGGKRYEATTAVTGAQPRNTSLVIVGTGYYVKEGSSPKWVHLDLARVDPASSRQVNYADPSGMARLLTDMETATARREATGWSGRFDPRQKGEYLPPGSPAFWALATSLPFTLTVDGQGLVTSIVIKLAPSSGPQITMTTTFSGHGAPVATKAPPKGSTVEADDVYYKK